MYRHDPSPPPRDAERGRRRIFSWLPAGGTQPGEPASEEDWASYQKVLDTRLQQGLESIQRMANTLMHEIASEVWRAAGGDKEQAQAKILEGISRDQAIRSLVAHSDERFQDLAVRTGRLEDSVSSLAEDTRAARAALADSVQALESAVGTPAVRGYEELRGRLEQVTRIVAEAFQALAERDRVIVETVQEQVKEHGEVTTRETGRVAKAIEAYVREGVNTLSLLAGRIDAQVEIIAKQDRQLLAPSGEGGALADLLGQQLDMANERLGIDIRDMRASVGAAIEAAQEINRTLDSGIRGLAQLIRSDSEALRGEIDRRTAPIDEQAARAVDEQLGRISEAITSATRWTVEELTQRIHEETSRAIEDQLDAMIAKVGRASEAAIDAAIAGRLETAIDRLVASAQTAQRTGRESEEELARVVDERITALGRMVRSDNQALSSRMQVAVEQEAAKQVLRAVKELEANLPSEMQEVVEARVQAVAEQLQRDVAATNETVARLGDALERKIEESTSRLGQNQDREIQIVIDRMGQAMQALGSSLGRPAPTADRVEID